MHISIPVPTSLLWLAARQAYAEYRKEWIGHDPSNASMPAFECLPEYAQSFWFSTVRAISITVDGAEAPCRECLLNEKKLTRLEALNKTSNVEIERLSTLLRIAEKAAKDFKANAAAVEVHFRNAKREARDADDKLRAAKAEIRKIKREARAVPMKPSKRQTRKS